MKQPAKIKSSIQNGSRMWYFLGVQLVEIASAYNCVSIELVIQKLVSI